MSENTGPDINPIKERLAKATPGPWKWMEEAFRPKYMQQLKNGRWRAKQGKSADSAWVMLLAGPRKKLCGEEHFPPLDQWSVSLVGGYPDEWDYPHIIALRWNQIKGEILFNVTPGAGDADLIANAPTDIATLLAEVERLRMLLNLKEEDYG